MLSYARTFFVWCCVAFLLALVAWGATYSPSYRKCVSDYSDHKSAEESPDLYKPVASSPEVVLPLFLRCEGAFIDENSGTLTALATIAIAGFTLTLWRATTEQGRLTQASVDLARQEFISTHRPKLRMRLLFLARLEHGHPIEIQYQLVNIGDTKARIIRNEVTLRVEVGRADPILGAGDGAVGREIPKGGHLLVRIITDILYDKAWDFVNFGDEQVQCSGFVTYLDDNDAPRSTAFCRISVRGGRFRNLDPPQPDYEYED